MSTLLAMSILLMAKPVVDEGPMVSRDQIQILPVARTPESSTVTLRVAVPGRGSLVSSNPVWIQFRLDGYSLGSASQFERAREIPVSKMGQTIHLIIDNNPYIAVNEPAIDPFNEEGFYYDTSYKIELPYSLKDGIHTIRMFPARSFGESLKSDNTFVSTYFYLGRREEDLEMNLNKPYLTYNEPSDQMPLSSKQPVLLDFYITNCELSSDGYKVHLTIDGDFHQDITSWQPFYIYGLKKGKHNVRLQLVDPKGNQVSGSFNDVERVIHVQ